MELAGRIYDVVTREDNVTDEIREVVPTMANSREHSYWRSVVRLAALCHDTGHLPFSHAAEEALLPKGWDHERMTWEIIHSDVLGAVWKTMVPKPDPDHVGMLALGPRKIEKLRLDFAFSPWEGILAEIIVGDVFGADRIDYLLRDSLHSGVAYGRFDHNRLIDTLRVIPQPPREVGESVDSPGGEPALGCKRGGLESAEALLLARYFMFAQVYFHPTRLIYDAHLKDFLQAWLPEGKFRIGVQDHLGISDNEVLAAMASACNDPGAPGHDHAKRILTRKHFRVAQTRRPGDPAGAMRAMAEAAGKEFGEGNVRYGASPRRPEPPDFPVLDRDGRSVSSLSLSEVMARLPASRDEYVFVAPEIRKDARGWMNSRRDEIIKAANEGERD